MFFKNVMIFKLTEAWLMSAEQLSEKLQLAQFKPCGPHDYISKGWVSLITNSENLVHSANGYMMVRLHCEEKILPSSVVNDILKNKVSEIEKLESRRLSKKERTEIKDEIIFDSLPKAFTKSSDLYAYIDVKNGWIVIDTASSNKAESLLSLLRKCLGSLPVVPLNTVDTPKVILTHLLEGILVNKLFFKGNDCVLKDEESGVVRFKNLDLSMPEVIEHLSTGKYVSQLAFEFDNRLSFVLDDSLTVRRLKFLDLALEPLLNQDAETEAERFDADFAIMTFELSGFIECLIQLFGGI